MEKKEEEKKEVRNNENEDDEAEEDEEGYVESYDMNTDFPNSEKFYEEEDEQEEVGYDFGLYWYIYCETKFLLFFARLVDFMRINIGESKQIYGFIGSLILLYQLDSNK